MSIRPCFYECMKESVLKMNNNVLYCSICSVSGAGCKYSQDPYVCFVPTPRGEICMDPRVLQGRISREGGGVGVFPSLGIENGAIKG